MSDWQPQVLFSVQQINRTRYCALESAVMQIVHSRAYVVTDKKNNGVVTPITINLEQICVGEAQR